MTRPAAADSSTMSALATMASRRPRHSTASRAVTRMSGARKNTTINDAQAVTPASSGVQSAPNSSASSTTKGSMKRHDHPSARRDAAPPRVVA